MKLRQKPTHGGRRKGAGRPAPNGRGKTFCLYLSPPEQAECLRHGGTVQEGLRRLVAMAGK